MSADSASRTTPPPGFVASTTQSHGLNASNGGSGGAGGAGSTSGAIHSFEGDNESNDNSQVEAPPPGFNGYSRGELKDWDEELKNQNNGMNANAPSWNGGSNGNNTTTHHDDNNPKTRTESFSNLAAVIGTGLVESMDDSTGDVMGTNIWEGKSHLFDPKQDLNYHRQFRHTASRLKKRFDHQQPLSSPITSAPIATSTITSSTTTISSSFDNVKPDEPAAFGGYQPADDPLDFKRNANVSSPFRQLPSSGGIFEEDIFHPIGGGNGGGDVGLTVIEPMEFGRNSAPPELFGEFSSRTGTPELGELTRSVQNLEFERRSSYRSTGSHDDVSLDLSLHASESELHRFCWDVRHSEPSRMLAIFRADCVLMSDLRSTCEAFGVLELFRTDFDERGVIFVGYYDIRSAQQAAMELRSCLRRLAADDGYDTNIDVKYCVPLNSSSAMDESVLVFSDLPPSIKEDTLMSILSSYGAVRSVKRQAGSHFGTNLAYSYTVEFHSIQDAKQALLELESTQPWGPGIMIEVGQRSAAERQRGRELLSLLGRWREGRRSNHSSPVSGGRLTPLSGGRLTPLSGGRLTPTSPHTPRQWTSARSPSVETRPQARRGRPSSISPTPIIPHPPNLGGLIRRDSRENTASAASHQPPHLVIGPDGSYSYVTINQMSYQGHHHHHHHHPPQAMNHMDLHGHPSQVPPPQSPQQHLVPGPHGAFVSSVTHNSMPPPPPPPPPPNVHHQYWSHPGHPTQYHVPTGPTVVTSTPYHDRSVYPQAAPYYAHVVGNPTDSSVSSGSNSNPPTVQSSIRRPPNAGSSNNHNNSNNNGDDKDNRHLQLNIDAVDSGRDTRTSLMVRNIPNKYTQQMLLSEFTENGHGPGKIDFFYLPIDFKNKCNRGYAFVNFVDYRDIVAFHRQYFGQHWRVFNSDKICDITYARIQGKAGMLKRFENSALMEKDDEYKPLVFVSHGANKGQRVPFPSHAAKNAD